MKVMPTSLPGVLLIQPRVFSDPRGFFMETWQAHRYQLEGIPGRFVQDNYSCSTRGVLRGLHYQLKHPQGKLVYVLQGEVFDVAVDIRQGSPTFGHWTSAVLSGKNHHQLYIPAGFAHGFCVLSETAHFLYKCTDFYEPGDEYGLRWDDPSLGINWPLSAPQLSEKDGQYPTLDSVAQEYLPVAEDLR
ncbi:MAG: dTDP-4-dehydrorhamnose 3,5-epimerase [Candidatus Entotheonella factor]|uniref:dTDP-4-dehydrorhamnose 3,5-epimerase n=1 Tax=Entotheonella factor TaxID=1429438 RepID=W4LMB7_ENTF1|nr:MAG: dTDP-4-dehydrorhamnose 3,5-epimerase [Candidatus Entotheonella factor]